MEQKRKNDTPLLRGLLAASKYEEEGAFQGTECGIYC